MSYAGADEITPIYYKGIADELDVLAHSVRNHPNLNGHFADRLHELARQLREDVRLMTVKMKVG